MRRLFIIFGILNSIFVGIVVAHDLYLRPESFYLDKPGQLSIEMQLTEERFPGDALKWRGNKTVQFTAIGPAGNQNIQDSEGQNPQINFVQNGTYQIGWQSKVNYISIEPEIFEKYITLEGYKDTIESRKNDKNSPGRERYSRFIKTFVQVGNQASDNFKKPVGFKIEIIPQTNPLNLKVGDELLVQVLFEGKPLPGNKIMATYDKYSTMPEDYAQTIETQLDGTARFKITHPGLWMIRTNRMLPVRGDEKADWESFWSNVTFIVR